VPRDQRGKGFFGIAIRVFPQQCDVIPFLHPYLNAADEGKVTVFFCGRLGCLTRISRTSTNSNTLKALRKLAQGWNAVTTLGNRPINNSFSHPMGEGGRRPDKGAIKVRKYL
jgi:hypothetical protein